MRIGVVTTSYPRFPGDPAGNFVAELSSWIAGRGHRVAVIAAGDTYIDDAWQNVPVERVSAGAELFYDGGAPDALGARGGSLAALRFSAALSIAVGKRARNWDGIVAHWLAPCGVAAALAAPTLPLWAIAHGGDVHLLRKLRLIRPASRVLGRARVSFVSAALRESIAGQGRAGRDLANRSSVAAMGIDLAHFRALPKTREVNARPLLLFLGRLVAIKGVDLLLRALEGQAHAWDICIAGAGPSGAELRRQAERLGIEANWVGEVHGGARDALLARANVVVIPSRRYEGREEGMPRVALEALAAGAELVVSESGGLSEIPESICHRVPCEDVPALAAAIAALGQGARAAFGPGHWLDEHDWDALGPRLLPGLGLG